MDSDVAEVEQAPKNSSGGKVHDAICRELVKISEKIVGILPAIESARPGSSSGIQILCILNNTVEKTKLLVYHCAESSRLYLATTAESIVLRCERIRTELNQNLCQIQTMVPQVLASKIAEVLDYLRGIKFIIDPGEEVAGKALLNLLAQTDLSEEQEFEVFHIVCSRLNIKSSIALLVERRSIKKLLDKFLGVDDKKKRILKYFLYLIKKYGKQLRPDTREYKENANALDNCLNVRIDSMSDTFKHDDTDRPPTNYVEIQSESLNCDMPPEEFCCPISSRLMYDPVVIASGQTYERIWIEKWFNEGHDTCPKTQKKLENFLVIPNSCMKDLISNWCKKHDVSDLVPCTQTEEAAPDTWQPTCSDSVSNLKNVSNALLDGTKGDCLLDHALSNVSTMSSGACCSSDSSLIKPIESSNNNHAQMFSWSDDYRRHQSFSIFNKEMYLRFLFGLSGLPALLQAKAVEDLKNLLGDEATFCAMLSNGFAEALMLFLQKSSTLFDIPAQRSGAQFFLALVNNKRLELTFLREDSFQLLSSFLNCGIDKEALMILQKLAHHPDCMSYIAISSIPVDLVQFLNSEDSEYVEIAVQILSELSSHREMRTHFLYSGCFENVCQLLSDRRLVSNCLNILHNLIDGEEASVAIVDTKCCIASITEILESGNHEEQKQAVTILLTLCSRSLHNCLLVLKKGIIPLLVDISANGSQGKENSMKLLHILRDIRHSHCPDSPQQPRAESESRVIKHPIVSSKKLITNYKSFGFFSRKMRHIKSLALF